MPARQAPLGITQRLALLPPTDDPDRRGCQVAVAIATHCFPSATLDAIPALARRLVPMPAYVTDETLREVAEELAVAEGLRLIDTELAAAMSGAGDGG